jgi:integrase
VNAVTGKASPGPGYAASTVAHCETVCRSFYDYHLETGAGPLANPFPLARKNSRAHAHHNPMEPFRKERAGLFRPRQPKRIPRVSTGARASELLGVTRGSTDPGSQLVTVIRKGSRAMQPLPASPDAFVWLRLYQEEMHGLVPSGPDGTVWWTLRRPFRPLSYHAARAMFTRAGASLGANWSLHDLRHCAAYRMARDPEMPITDVQWILGHAHLTTTQIYVTPTADDVVRSVLAHHQRQAAPKPPLQPAPGYRAESLGILFGERQ